MARCHVIGQRKEGFEEGFISFHGGWKRHQRCVCEASANRLGLSTFVPIAPDTSLLASAIQSFATEFTGAITEVIGRDHPVSSFERSYVWPNIFNHAHPFMPDLPTWRIGTLSPIRPEISAANTSVSDTYDGVSWLKEACIGYLLHPNIECSTKHGCTHIVSPSLLKLQGEMFSPLLLLDF